MTQDPPSWQGSITRNGVTTTYTDPVAFAEATGMQVCTVGGYVMLVGDMNDIHNEQIDEAAIERYRQEIEAWIRAIQIERDRI